MWNLTDRLIAYNDCFRYFNSRKKVYRSNGRHAARKQMEKQATYWYRKYRSLKQKGKV